MHGQYKLLACCVLLTLVGGCKRAEVVSPTQLPLPAIIPAPRELARADGQFVVTQNTSVLFDANSQVASEYFIGLVKRTANLDLRSMSAAQSPAKGVIRFELNAGESRDGQEAYSLIISPERIVVSAADSRGLFYGAVTLWQVLTSVTPQNGAYVLPAIKIDDAPRFRWRGLMLDSARHFQSPQFIKEFIDWMALHKLNVLHWHLTDDQGWRLEIKKYPRLTSIGAWRVPAGAAAFDTDPATGKPRLYGGFYSQDEVRDIVAYATSRNITIVPEIETPGHASAAIAAYPKLGVLGKKSAVPSDWGIYPNLYNVDDATFTFLEDVLSEVMDLFPSPYIHVGGDEAVKDQWVASRKIQAQMRTLGIKDEHALQSYFIQRLEKFSNAHGRKLIGWDEILEGGLAPNATVMSWRGLDGAVAAANAGHDAVLSPWPTLYFDNRQAEDAQPGRGRMVTIKDVYQFDPAPKPLSAQQRTHILGVQANIWTEHMRTEDRVEYMTFPRAAALAEVAWSPADKIHWEDFATRLPTELQRYRALGIHYAQAPAPQSIEPNRRTSHQLQLCTDKLVLSLEDDAPLTGPRPAFWVDVMNPCWIYPSVNLGEISAIKASVGQVPFNFQIGKDVNAIPLPPPRTPSGELQVHQDTCDGKVVADVPLASAVANPAVTALPTTEFTQHSGMHDLCLIFARKSVDPTWVIDSVELVKR